MDARGGSLWYKRAGTCNSSDLTSTSRWRTLPCFVLDQDPREQPSDGGMVVFRVMDKNPVIKVGVQVEVVDIFCVFFIYSVVCVAHPEVYCCHVAAP